MLYIPEIEKINKYHSPQYAYYDGFSTAYEVKINGKVCPVRSCRVSKDRFNTIWPGHQRDIAQSEWASFISFFGDEEVTLEVKCNLPFENIYVRPLSKGIETQIIDDTVIFTLKQNGNFVLETDDSHGALHIFYSKNKELPKPEDVTYYFGPGIHKPLLLNLKNNDSVFIHPEAVVFTTVYASDVENIHIFGGGVLNNSCQERVDDSCYGDFPIGNIRMSKSSNIKIEDVILIDSASWVCALFNCKNIEIDNIKIVGQWRYNTDGIDITNTCNVLIKNSFIRSFDDSICVKALNKFDVCENIHVENCVCWCDWGKTLELGLETSANEYRNITFKNCDLIHNATAAMAISNGNHAEIHDIYYENINVEFQSTTRKQIYQDNDEMVYIDDGKTDMAALIRLDNTLFSASYPEYNLSDEKYGYTHDIKFKNINVYSDIKDKKIKLHLVSISEDATVKNVYIDNVSVNGKNIDTINYFEINNQNAINIFYNGEIF